MTVQVSREDSLGAHLPLSLMSNVHEWIPDLQPRPGGIRFARESPWVWPFACPFGLWFAGLSSFIKKPIP
jgi:hypothetical protein